MRVAVVGGGINGLCAAWFLAEAGHKVALFEKNRLLSATSSASSKLLHGGIRYLENFEFRLVKEALEQRAWWLKHVPQHAAPLKLFLPIYHGSKRPAWKVWLGLWLYDLLAGKANIGWHSSINVSEMSTIAPELKQEGIRSLFSFYDGQMDEAGLGGWVAEQARYSGAELIEGCEVKRITADGMLFHASGHGTFDRVINVAGPWVERLNDESGIKSNHKLDLVRGSHIVLDRRIDHGYLLEVPGDQRIFFVLPYDGRTLVGTTEVRQSLNEAVKCSREERDYLLRAYNQYFITQADSDDVVAEFAGLRPLIRSASEPARATREYAIERCGKVVSVFGGKWTTARSLAANIVKEVNRGIH